MKKAKYLYVLIPVLIASLILNGLSVFQAGKINSRTIKMAGQIADLNLTAGECGDMVQSLRSKTADYRAVRKLKMENRQAPAFDFNCLPAGFEIRPRQEEFIAAVREPVVLPENIEDIAFWPISDLALLIKTRQISSCRLTMIYLNRLKKYGPKLKCVITLTEKLALKQAALADKEIQAGNYRGGLHGIPYGVKDLLAVPEYNTTWGAMPYKDQVLLEKARVVELLEEAGAVLVAKLSLGALAMGDVWFGGKTLNPWNYTEGSGGSSAGPATATAAGLVGFSIGSETWGSIVSPATRCRVTGFRPTWGRVSRAGAMTLSWTMDKIGPICRSVEGCALVFKAINGADPKDRSTRKVEFSYNGKESISRLRIGFLKNEFEKDSTNVRKYNDLIELLSRAGADLIPMRLPDFPVMALANILSAEAAAAFDELTRSDRDDLLVRQGRGDWPNTFRQAHFIPAVEYIQANRARLLLMEELAKIMTNIDVFVAPSFGPQLLMTNLTGHPAVVVPVGDDADKHSMSLTFIGQLYEDGRVLQAAQAFQNASEYHEKYPNLEEFK